MPPSSTGATSASSTGHCALDARRFVQYHVIRTFARNDYNLVDAALCYESNSKSRGVRVLQDVKQGQIVAIYPGYAMRAPFEEATPEDVTRRIAEDDSPTTQYTLTHHMSARKMEQWRRHFPRAPSGATNMHMGFEIDPLASSMEVHMLRELLGKGRSNSPKSAHILRDAQRMLRMFETYTGPGLSLPENWHGSFVSIGFQVRMLTNVSFDDDPRVLQRCHNLQWEDVDLKNTKSRFLDVVSEVAGNEHMIRTAILQGLMLRLTVPSSYPHMACFINEPTIDDGTEANVTISHLTDDELEMLKDSLHDAEEFGATPRPCIRATKELACMTTLLVAYNYST